MARQPAKPVEHVMGCDICGRTRPENTVDDLVVEVSDCIGFELPYVGLVVSHCLDASDCRDKASARVENFRQWLAERHREKPFKGGAGRP